MARDADGSPLLWRGPDTLRDRLEPLAALHEDPANANLHDAASLAAIAGSYARFGQQKTLVVDGAGVVRAGNGQLIAARRLGWTHLAVTRSDLTGAELTAYALADNQTARHSELDQERLTGQLQALRAEGAAIDDLGWSEGELARILEAEWTPPALAPLPDPASGREDGDGEPGQDRVIALEPLQRAAIDAAVRTLREVHGDSRMSESLCVQMICRAYLAELDG